MNRNSDADRRRLQPMPDESIGTFHAVHTRDAEALSRDGEPYFAARSIRQTNTESLYEICFADGEWMLADLRDLDF